MASVRRASAIAVGAAAEVAGDEREVARFDRDVGTGPDRDAEVRLRERGRVVDAVADDRDLVARGLQLAHHVDLLSGEHLGDHPVDPRPPRRPRRRWPGGRP